MNGRRDVLRSLASLPLTSVVGASLALPTDAAQAASPVPDAELLALGKEWQTARLEWLAAPDEIGDMPLWRRRTDLEDHICRTPAHSLAGLAVKALLLVSIIGELDDLSDERINIGFDQADNTGDTVTFGIAADILRLSRTATIGADWRRER